MGKLTQADDRDTRQAALFRDLETQILDLRDMAAIMSDFVPDYVSLAKGKKEDGLLHFILDPATVRAIMFAIVDVSNRAEDLALKYESGFKGNLPDKTA
jgi:hypothetical protein